MPLHDFLGYISVFSGLLLGVYASPTRVTAFVILTIVLGLALNPTIQENSWLSPTIPATTLASVNSTAPSAPPQGPLTRFLLSNGVTPNRTLFVGMASKSYIPLMLNFKLGLTKYQLEKDYLILCLDQACLDACKEHDVLAYGGYRLDNETVLQAAGGWRNPIAKAKVMKQLIRKTDWVPVRNKHRSH